LAMATATKNARSKRHVAGGSRDVSESPSMEFLIVEDNGGRYHWDIVDGGGVSLGRSEDFASDGEAESAARAVLDGAGSARFQGRESELAKVPAGR
jgi:hypothetical protein